MLLVLSAATLVVLIGALVEVSVGMRRLRRLPDVRLPDRDALGPGGQPWPSVSILIPARNEERNIAEALRSVLSLDYPAREVLLVDDRSTDATAALVMELAREYPTLRVVSIDALPDGWIGKNHALWVGAAQTTGEWLLFTDADIVMAPDLLRRAVTVVLEDRLDHLAAAPTVLARKPLLAMMVATFGLLFTLHTRPWRIPSPRTRAHIGIGAFNLVRRSAYEAVGTHARIALSPDDDLQLGKAIKRAGFRQALALAGPLMAVEWYASLRELVDGLMKNAFAGLGYSVPAVVGSCMALVLLNVWPFAALLVTGGVTWWLNVATVVCAVTLFVVHARIYGSSGWQVVGYPAAVLLFCWILVRSAWLALSRGAIEWRGRRYPLDALRRARLR